MSEHEVYMMLEENEISNVVDAYYKGRVDAEKEDLVRACINQLKESDADEVKVSVDTKDGYKITVIVELKEQTNEADRISEGNR